MILWKRNMSKFFPTICMETWLGKELENLLSGCFIKDTEKLSSEKEIFISENGI